MALRPVSGLGVQRYVPHLAGIPSIAWSFELALAQYPGTWNTLQFHTA